MLLSLHKKFFGFICYSDIVKKKKVYKNSTKSLSMNVKLNDVAKKTR